jgi:uncharacterized membrane protein
MARVIKSVRINAPVKTVFDVVTEPDNWTRYVTSLVSVTHRSDDLPRKGSTFRWEYRMMGVKFTGKGEVSEHTKNKRFGLKLTGKATITEGYEFTDNGDGTTELKVSVEYEMPGEMMQAIMDTKLVQKLNALDSKAVMDKIKMICEAV